MQCRHQADQRRKYFIVHRAEMRRCCSLAGDMQHYAAVTRNLQLNKYLCTLAIKHESPLSKVPIYIPGVARLQPGIAARHLTPPPPGSGVLFLPRPGPEMSAIYQM